MVKYGTFTGFADFSFFGRMPASQPSFPDNFGNPPVSSAKNVSEPSADPSTGSMFPGLRRDFQQPSGAVQSALFSNIIYCNKY
jgi:hypothetical protein